MKIVIIAGPNGAGKATFAEEFLPFEADCPLFVNADLIAAGLSPFQPAAGLLAGRAAAAAGALRGDRRDVVAEEAALLDYDPGAAPAHSSPTRPTRTGFGSSRFGS